MEHLGLLLQACKCRTQLCGIVLPCNNAMILNVARFGVLIWEHDHGWSKLKKENIPTKQENSQRNKI